MKNVYKYYDPSTVIRRTKLNATNPELVQAARKMYLESLED